MTKASASEKTTGHSKWLRVLLWCGVSGVLLLVIALVTGAALWHHYFGRVGEPIESLVMKQDVDPRIAQLDECDRYFREMRQTLRKTEDLRGQLFKQERIEGRLEPRCTLQVKIRKQPRSIYLRWEEPFAGRELIWEVHRRTNRLIAHEGAPLRAISPDVLMALNHPLALKFSNHHISELSVQFILSEMPRYLEDAKANPDLEITVNEDLQLAERTCVHIRFIHPEGKSAPSHYARFDIYLDNKDRMPVRWERYSRSEEGEMQLDEYFELGDIETNVGLTDEDFDPAHEDYNFRPDWLSPLGPKPEANGLIPDEGSDS